MAGFAVKVPLFPVHTWLPLAHTEAPTAGSVLLAGVLLKLGTYGLYRFAIPMVPDAVVEYAPFIAVLAIVGVAMLLLLALGLLRVGVRKPGPDIARGYLDTVGEGVVITDRAGRIVYANPAYLEITGSDSGGAARPIERLFSGDAKAAEAVYRIAQGVREGHDAEEEVRLSAPLSGGRNGGARWYRIRARAIPAARGGRPPEMAVVGHGDEVSKFLQGHGRMIENIYGKIKHNRLAVFRNNSYYGSKRKTIHPAGADEARFERKDTTMSRNPEIA